jgi:hypothetical protein
MPRSLFILAAGVFLAATAASADATAAAAAAAAAQLPIIRVSAPAYGATVRGDTVITVPSEGFEQVTASCWMGDAALGHAEPLYLAPADKLVGIDQGFSFPAADFPHGPLAVRIVGTRGDGSTDTCSWALYNAAGKPWHEGLAAAPVPAPASGMTVAFSDEFDQPPSISRSGTGARYCSRKPDDSEFGDAIFGDHEGPYDPFATVDTYLRIHCSRPKGLVDPMPWKRTAVSGCFSCLHTDGSGFHTDGGHEAYFEARLLYGAAPGSWPAFWLLSSGNYKGTADQQCDEFDLMENHLPKMASYHVAHHQWNYGDVHVALTPEPAMAAIGGGADGCQAFHTYGCLITEKTTSVFLDNVKIWDFPTEPTAWREGMYFCINNGLRAADMDLGGGFGRYGGTCDLWVDWVRVFEKK